MAAVQGQSKKCSVNDIKPQLLRSPAFEWESDTLFSYLFKTLKLRLLPFLLVIAACATTFADDQLNDSRTPSDCLPEITFFYNNSSQLICLNQFAPSDDSCANLEIIFDKMRGIKAHFSYNFEHKWLFDSVGYSDQSLQNSKVQANITTDESGNLIKMQLFLGDHKDSLTLNPKIKRNGDIPDILPDSTVPHSSFFISKTTFFCMPQPKKTVIVDRKYTYPVGYMKREPVYNYPELKMFHCGGSVHFPTSESVKMKGVYINEYHVLTPYELKYEEPKKEIIRNVSKQKPKKMRKGFFKIRPL